MPATAAAGIYKALQATSTTTSGGVLINRVLAHHIQHSTFATCVHYLRQAAEADQVGQGRVHCISVGRQTHADLATAVDSTADV